MRQTLALLLVLALIGSVFANGELSDRRRKTMEKKLAARQRVKSVNPGMMGSNMDYSRVQELTQKAQSQAGLKKLNKKFNTFKSAAVNGAEQIAKMRNRMGAQMDIKGMKDGMRRRGSYMKKPFY